MDTGRVRAVRLSAEDAVFEVERLRLDVEVLFDRVNGLVRDLDATLPEAHANDVTVGLRQLAQAVRTRVDEGVDRARDRLMEWGMPFDDVECDRCGSSDFSRQDCPACNEVRSDGLRLARRLAGWMI